MSEPNKSKKQLSKVVGAVNNFVLTRSDYIAVLKQLVCNTDVVEGTDSESYLVQMLEQANGAPVETSDALEKATIIARAFGRKTSVVYDSRAICDLFEKEGQSETTKELLACLLHLQLRLVRQNLSQ